MGCFGFSVGGMQENCYLFFDDETKEAAVIDPGADIDVITEHLHEKGLTVTHILLTHGHYDHTGAVEALRKATNAPLLAHKDEEQLLSDPRMSYAAAGAIKPDGFFNDGDIINIGDKKLRVIHTPGHTAGSCCFYTEDEAVLFSGDTLFRESIGRHDFPTGSFKALMNSIKNKLYILPDNTDVWPGHMEESTIGYEKAHNSFVE